MKKDVRTCIILVVCISILLACEGKNLTTQEIERREWMHAQGYRLNDFIRFDHPDLRISNDTIFRKGKPVALVIRGYERIGSTEELIIKSLNTNREGTYSFFGLVK